MEDYKGAGKEKSDWRMKRREKVTHKNKAECVIEKRYWHKIKLLNLEVKTHPDLQGFRQ